MQNGATTLRDARTMPQRCPPQDARVPALQVACSYRSVATRAVAARTSAAVAPTLQVARDSAPSTNVAAAALSAGARGAARRCRSAGSRQMLRYRAQAPARLDGAPTHRRDCPHAFRHPPGAPAVLQMPHFHRRRTEDRSAASMSRRSPADIGKASRYFSTSASVSGSSPTPGLGRNSTFRTACWCRS